jgi:hypothetical protein
VFEAVKSDGAFLANVFGLSFFCMGKGVLFCPVKDLYWDGGASGVFKP